MCGVLIDFFKKNNEMTHFAGTIVVLWNISLVTESSPPHRLVEAIDIKIYVTEGVVICIKLTFGIMFDILFAHFNFYNLIEIEQMGSISTVLSMSLFGSWLLLIGRAPKH